MRKSEPHSEAGNSAGPRAGEGHDPVSKRAAIAAFTVPSRRISVGPPGCNQTLFEEPYAICGGADPVTGRPTRSLPGRPAFPYTDGPLCRD